MLERPGRPGHRSTATRWIAVRELLAPHRRGTRCPGCRRSRAARPATSATTTGRVLERLPAPRYDDLALPDVMLGLYDWVHRVGPPARRRVAGLDRAARDGAARAARAPGARCAMVRERLRGPARPAPRLPGAVGRRRAPQPALRQAPSYPVLGVDGAEAVGLRSTFTHRGYLDAVARVREYIVAGDIFQANLSQRFRRRSPSRRSSSTAGSGAGTPRRSPPISTSATSAC